MLTFTGVRTILDFREASDQLTECVTHGEIAREAGVSVQSIRVARLDRGSSGYRSPPADWPAVLARVARRHAKKLEALAARLEKER